MSIVKLLNSLSISVHNLSDHGNLLCPSFRLRSLEKDGSVILRCPLDKRYKSSKSDRALSKRRVSVQMRTEQCLTVVQMKAVELVESDMFIPLSKNIIPVAQVITAASGVGCVEAECYRQIFQISVIKLPKLCNA